MEATTRTTSSISARPATTRSPFTSQEQKNLGSTPGKLKAPRAYRFHLSEDLWQTFYDESLAASTGESPGRVTQGVLPLGLKLERKGQPSSIPPRAYRAGNPGRAAAPAGSRQAARMGGGSGPGRPGQGGEGARTWDRPQGQKATGGGQFSDRPGPEASRSPGTRAPPGPSVPASSQHAALLERKERLPVPKDHMVKDRDTKELPGFSQPPS